MHARTSTGATEYSHDAVPACVAVKTLSPTVIIALRDPVPGFASTENDTRRLPVPAPPGGSVTRSHGAPLTATHAQVDGAVTSNEPLPPDTLNVSPVREVDRAAGQRRLRDRVRRVAGRDAARARRGVGVGRRAIRHRAVARTRASRHDREPRAPSGRPSSRSPRPC